MPQNYPHQTPNHISWRSSTLYSIAGWMSSWYGWDGIEFGTAFGGYFRLDQEIGHIEGEIVDTFGAARIEGLLEDNSLRFQKTYILRALPHTAPGIIHYEFERAGDGWQGGFTLHSGTKGKAICKIQPVIDDAFGLVIGPVRRD